MKFELVLKLSWRPLWTGVAIRVPCFGLDGMAWGICPNVGRDPCDMALKVWIFEGLKARGMRLHFVRFQDKRSSDRRPPNGTAILRLIVQTRFP